MSVIEFKQISTSVHTVVWFAINFSCWKVDSSSDNSWFFSFLSEVKKKSWFFPKLKKNHIQLPGLKAISIIFHPANWTEQKLNGDWKPLTKRKWEPSFQWNGFPKKNYHYQRKICYSISRLWKQPKILIGVEKYYVFYTIAKNFQMRYLHLIPLSYLILRGWIASKYVFQIKSSDMGNFFNLYEKYTWWLVWDRKPGIDLLKEVN